MCLNGDLFEQLSDDVLLHIFSYLDASILCILSRVSPRWYSLTKTKFLWWYVDARHPPNYEDKQHFCKNSINEGTSTLRLAGSSRFRTLLDGQSFIIPQKEIQSNTYNKLTVLALENTRINCNILLKHFPRTLVELSLRNSYSDSQHNFFRHSYATMSNLKVLIVDSCRWITGSSFLSISKFPSLEVLSMYRCTKLLDGDIAYISMASNFGFKQLQVLDVRYTDLGDLLISAMYHKENLHSLYFASYSYSFYPDFFNRCREIRNGASKINPLNYMESQFNFDERKRSKWAELLESNTEWIGRKSYQSVTSTSAHYFGWHQSFPLLFFSQVYNNGAIEELQKYGQPCICNNRGRRLKKVGTTGPVEHTSALYTHPYNSPCTCNIDATDKTASKTARDWPVYHLTSRNVKPISRRGPQNDEECHNFVRDRRMEELVLPFENGRLMNDHVNDNELDDEYERCIAELAADSLIDTMEMSAFSTESFKNVQKNYDDDVDGFKENRKRKRCPSGDDANGENDDNDDDDDDDDNAPSKMSCSFLSRPIVHEVEPLLPDEIVYSRRPIVIVRNVGNLIAQHPIREPIEQHYPIVPIDYYRKFYVTQFRALSFRGFQKVTDEMLNQLSYLSLEVLDVTGTNVSEAAIRMFTAQNPNCRLIHQSTCKCLPSMHF